MTKFEWERQLKDGIASLPKSEQQRVLDYYNELFADKIESRMREQDIIAEFGNPYDVANKLIVDYFSEGGDNSRADEYIYNDNVRDFDSYEIEEDFPSSSKHGSKIKKEKVKITNEQKTTGSVSGVFSILAIIYFFVMGAVVGRWHPTWMVFLFIPVVSTGVVAIQKRNPLVFCYPVLVTIMYLYLGFYANMWHPMWILFLTIPLYYTVLGMFAKNKKEEIIEEDYEVPVPIQSEIKEKKQVSKGAKASITVGKVFAGILFVFIAIVLWSVVISLFVAGIGMSIGGIAAMVVGIPQFAINVDFALLVIGLSLLVIGLGLLFTFGMASLFKYCGKATKAMFKSLGGAK